MKKKLISIIGGGWMGFPLSQAINTQDFDIIVTTAHDKSLQFNSDEISYTVLNIKTQSIPKNIIDSDIIVYLIPPMEIEYIHHFFDQLPKDKKIIFASSTSVYGKNMSAVDEESKLDNTNTNSPLLLAVEQYLKDKFESPTILRFGGLYGRKRHPAFFLQNKTDISGAHDLLHLVHLKDCIRAIKSVIENNAWGETFNIISDLRVEKKDYYTSICEKLKLNTPQYKNEQKSFKETNISNLKSKNILGIDYISPDEFCSDSE